MKQEKTRVRIINWPGITWFVLAVLAIVFFMIATGFIAFPQKYVLPLGLILVLIVAIMGILSLRRPKRSRHNKKRTPMQIFTIIMNCILSVLLFAGSVYVPILQAKMKGIFVEQSDTEEVKINAYVMTSAYKAAHTDAFTDTATSTDLADYKNSKFITQTKIDQTNQAYALEDIQKQLNQNTLNIVSKNDVISAAGSLYDGSGDVLILNENYASSITDVTGYESFNTDTQILYTVVKTVQVEKKAAVTQDYTNTPFMVYIAGSDTRSTALNYYTRTDVDMLLTVDPVNKQILLVSIPRDWYVKNPALGNGYDKLTHLGNNGLENTMDGLNQEFDFSYIQNYFEVNFTTFYNIVEAIGGIDINNPYAFSINNGAAGDTGHGEYSGYTFAEGELHLNGDQALSYVRERYNLPNGDYGRNEHQAIVLQAIIKKIASKEIISHFTSLLDNLQGNFLSSMSSDDIYSLAQMQLNDGGSWNFITYHLGGVGAHDVTASMGSQELYVSYPIKTQVDFVKSEMTKVMSGEIISQGTLPSEDQTVFLPN
ncbi:MAG: LCP family protein [Solobacterium sp.]|jgi:LCP family protein required for cell wall assembly|nr:LCP family protein [Solobacterium sp.]